MMFNQFQAMREGEALQQERMKEAETERLYKELGYDNPKISPAWLIIIILLLITMVSVY